MGMDKCYFVQKTAMTILAHNPHMGFDEIWDKAQGLADAGDKNFHEEPRFVKHALPRKIDPDTDGI